MTYFAEIQFWCNLHGCFVGTTTEVEAKNFQQAATIIDAVGLAVMKRHPELGLESFTRVIRPILSVVPYAKH